jgi:hypothetical protein
MLLVFSSNTLRSNQISKEIDLAEERGIRIIPIRVDNVEPSGGYVYRLKGYQYLDIFDDLDGGFNEHLSQIYKAVSRYLAEARDDATPIAAQLTASPQFIQDSDRSENEGNISQASFSDKNDKKTRALEICDNNSALANGPLAKIVQKELDITYSNAYYYVSRVWKRPQKLEEDVQALRRRDVATESTRLVSSGSSVSINEKRRPSGVSIGDKTDSMDELRARLKCCSCAWAGRERGAWQFREKNNAGYDLRHGGNRRPFCLLLQCS